MQDVEKNAKLKGKIFKLGYTQRKLSKATGIPEAYISRAVNGRYVLDPVQKAKISAVLGVPSQEIFNDSQR